MIDIGRNAIYFDDYVLAIQYFNLVINSKPYLYEPYFYRALAKFYLDDYTGAEADCSRAIERNPFFPSSYQVRGLSRIKLGKLSTAVEDYTKAVEMEPGNRSLWHNLTICYLELNRLHEADSICDRMLKQWPRQAEGYGIKCQIKMAEKDTVEAEKLIDKALEVDSNALTTVVDRVAVISEKSRGIKLALKKGKLIVTASNADEGSAEDEIEAGYDSADLEIGFNYRYLLDILAQIKGGTVRFLLLDGSSPVIIRDANDVSALYVLMPMRV